MEDGRMKLRNMQKKNEGGHARVFVYGKYLNQLRNIRLVLAILLFALSYTGLFTPGAKTAVIIMVAVLCGFDLGVDIWEEFDAKRLPLSRLLLLIAAVGSMFYSLRSGVLVFILYRLGNLLIASLVPMAENTIHSLFDLLPDKVCQLEPDGTEKEVSAASLTVGDMIVLRPGETAALDCAVFEGHSAVDYSLLVGDSAPGPAGPEDVIFSGAVNIASDLKAEVIAPSDASTVSKIRKMMLKEEGGRSETQVLADKLSTLVTPVVVAVGLILTAVWIFAADLTPGETVARLAVFLAMASPLGIDISIPLAYFAGRGRSAGLGILFDGPETIDKASDAAAVVFDKTGTLSTGEFRVVSVRSNKMSADTMLKLAAHAESYSTHPLAKAIINAYSGQIYIELVQNVREVPGQGLTANIGNIQIVLGSRDFLMSHHVVVTDEATDHEEVCIAVGGIYAGRILLSDSVRESALFAVELLKECVGESVYMLTSERETASRKTASAIGIEKYFSSCGAGDKEAHLAEIRAGIASGGNLMYVASGIAGVKMASESDLRVLMGGMRVPFETSNAHIVLLDDDPTKVAAAISASRSIRRTIFTNITAVLATKVAVLSLAALGFMPIWLAVLLDYAAAVSVILNAARPYSLKDSSSKWGRKHK